MDFVLRSPKYKQMRGLLQFNLHALNIVGLLLKPNIRIGAISKKPAIHSNHISQYIIVNIMLLWICAGWESFKFFGQVGK